MSHFGVSVAILYAGSAMPAPRGRKAGRGGLSRLEYLLAARLPALWELRVRPPGSLQSGGFIVWAGRSGPGGAV